MAIKCIRYTIELCASFFINADTDDKALETAEQLLDSDTFRENDLIPYLDDPFQWGEALNYAEIELIPTYEGIDEPTLSDEYVEKCINERN